MKHRGFSRLALRVYLYGVLMLALATGASFVVGNYVLRPAVDVPSRPSTAWIAWHLMRVADDPLTVEAELSDLRRRSRIEMSLFDAGGRLIASNANAPLRPLTPAELAKLRSAPTHFADGLGVVAEIQGGEVRRYARIRYPMPALPVGVAAAQLAAALLVLALLSIPLARSITAPVERLAAATRAFGKGDLAARAGSDRNDEIGDLARSFDEMADRVAALRRTEKELLANVSHELRTPLARIRLALDLVRSGDAARADSYLADIEEDLAELEQLLDGIMTAARLDLAPGSADPLPPLNPAEVEGKGLLEAAATRFGVRHPDRSLRCAIDEDVPALVADPILLRRVLDNLLDNAAKFSEAPQPIELEGKFQANPPALVIFVRDHGIGIAPDDLERVFEPFFRSDRSRARATGGVGLGLAVARRIVLAHAGSLSVDSSRHAGTCFRVEVPAREPAQRNRAPGLDRGACGQSGLEPAQDRTNRA
jgi:signal transduction histidine kinase